MVVYGESHSPAKIVIADSPVHSGEHRSVFDRPRCVDIVVPGLPEVPHNIPEFLDKFRDPPEGRSA